MLHRPRQLAGAGTSASCAHAVRSPGTSPDRLSSVIDPAIGPEHTSPSSRVDVLGEAKASCRGIFSQAPMRISPTQRSLDTVHLLTQARATSKELKRSDPLPARDDDLEGCWSAEGFNFPNRAASMRQGTFAPRAKGRTMQLNTSHARIAESSRG